MEMTIALIIGQILVSALCIYVSMWFVDVDGSFLIVLGAAAAGSLLTLVPEIGWIASAAGMFLVVWKLTSAELWEAIEVVAVASIVTPAVKFFLLMQVLTGVFGDAASEEKKAEGQTSIQSVSEEQGQKEVSSSSKAPEISDQAVTAAEKPENNYGSDSPTFGKDFKLKIEKGKITRTQETFLGLPLGIPRQQVQELIKRKGKHEMKLRTKNDASNCNLYRYTGNFRVGNATATTCVYYNGKLASMEIAFSAKETDLARMYDLVKRQTEEKYGKGKETSAETRKRFTTQKSKVVTTILQRPVPEQVPDKFKKLFPPSQEVLMLRGSHQPLAK